MLQLATCEPYSNIIHGDGPVNHFIVIYSYSLEEFYNNDWVDETQFYIKKTKALLKKNKCIHKIQSDKMNLVEIIRDPIGRELCILHTYKISIFKRIWKKKNLRT